MSFEKFTHVGRVYKPKVSVTRSGLLGFNQGAVKHFELEKYDWAILYYDKDGARIGIGLTNNENEDGICKLRKRAAGADVSARSFFDYYGIKYVQTKKYDAEWDEEEGMLVVSLS